MTGEPGLSVALALPRFRAALQSAASGATGPLRLPAADWLASRGRRGATWRRGWREWLLECSVLDAGSLRRYPAGACVRALAAGRPVDGTWACADPVHLLTGLDRLQLAPLSVLGLAAEEGRTLVQWLNQALAGSGFTLHHADPGPWSLECGSAIDCEAIEPALVEGEDIRELLPGGRDGLQVRRLMNELQMLLHEHPVNEERTRRGLPVVNALWLWGFGTALPASTVQLPLLHTDDRWLAGLWRLHDSAARTLDGVATAMLRTDTRALLVAGAQGDDRFDEPATRLRRWDFQLCEPLVAAAKQGQADELAVLFGDTPFMLARTSRFAFWRRGGALAEALR